MLNAQTLARRWRTERPADYMDRAIPPWLVGHTAEWAAARILECAPTAQAVAFRGISGALVAPIVAFKLGLNAIAVRKPGADCHNGITHHSIALEGSPVERYVIVDDFVNTGETIKKIVANHATRGMRLLAVFCYSRAISRSLDTTEGLAVKVPCLGCVPDEIDLLLR